MKMILILDTPERSLTELGQAFQAVAPDYTLEYVFEVEHLLGHLRALHPVELVALYYSGEPGVKNGASVIGRIREINESLPVIAVAERGSVELAAGAIQAGASDFLVKGDRLEERVATLLAKMGNVTRLIERNRRLRRQNRSLIESTGWQSQIIGNSPQIRALIEQIRRVAKIPRPVLIVGERGTGKELVARAIHAEAGSEERPLISVNCAAFADNLLESELFGHERGAFTGADSVARGKFEQADGGTLFLDEIGCMSLPFQQKILRAVEMGSITRVGGARELYVNVRIIAATNSDLQAKMKSGEFLHDLHDRLAFETLQVPPLREREGDVEVLAQYFLNRFMHEIPAFQGKWLSQEALAALRRYRFPGNVRELKNIIERAAYRDTTSDISPEDLGLREDFDEMEISGNFEEAVEAFKKRLLQKALRDAGGNQAQAARALGLTYYQFRHHCKKIEAVQERAGGG